jgi:hypothetical protein
MSDNIFASATSIKEVLGMLAGASSMCWDNISEAGVFQPGLASSFVEAAHERIAEITLDVVGEVIGRTSLFPSGGLDS